MEVTPELRWGEVTPPRRAHQIADPADRDDFLVLPRDWAERTPPFQTRPIAEPLAQANSPILPATNGGGPTQPVDSTALMVKLCLTTVKPILKVRNKGRSLADSDESETFDPSGSVEEQVKLLMEELKDQKIKLIRVRKKTNLDCKATMKAVNRESGQTLKLYAKQCGELHWRRMIKLLRERCGECGATFKYK